MTRTARLLDLIQALRRHRRPVAAATLAEAMGVSLRTVYRDIATLTAQGAPIEGSAGLGYVLRSGFFLPPLAFSADELDAVILGLHLAAQRGDEALAADAANALAKIEAVLPPPEADEARAPGLQAPRSARGAPSLTVLRQAIRAEHRLKLAYVDKTGAPTARVVWPITIGFFEAAEVLAAWCETRAISAISGWTGSGGRKAPASAMAAAAPSCWRSGGRCRTSTGDRCCRNLTRADAIRRAPQRRSGRHARLQSRDPVCGQPAGQRRVLCRSAGARAD